MKNLIHILPALFIAAFLLLSAGCADVPEPTTDGVTTPEPVTSETETEETVTTEEAVTTEQKRLELDFTKPLTAQGKRIHSLKCSENNYVTAQGCCFDGECWVVAFNRFDKNGEECTLLCKYDVNGKLVKTSDGPIYLEHANNITYLPQRRAYYVTSCQGTVSECWNGYSIVDRDTLEVIEKGTLEQPFFAMSYCPERDAFASARWGGETLDFWDGKLGHLAEKSVDPPGTLSQGVFADTEYVWFVRSSQNGYQQEFRVYDWDGELVTTIPLHLKNDAESESVNIIDGVVYVTSNAGRIAHLYRVEFSEAE
ncbi:MAG: hypothetical protein J5879_07160 [Clostridia bacterium]|nr:hypothetical protein [Clostridia bacterium]